MAATRLTNNMRADIRRALMKRAYIERKAEVQRMEHALARAVYDDVYTPEEQAKMLSMGEKFFVYHASFKVEFSKDSYSYTALELYEAMPFGYEHNRGTFCTLAGAPAHPLQIQFDAWKQAKKQLDDDLERLAGEAMYMLNGCGTVKKLCAEWPEICPLIAQLGIRQEEAREYLPAISHDVNRLFDLPPAAAAVQEDTFFYEIADQELQPGAGEAA